MKALRPLLALIALLAAGTAAAHPGHAEIGFGAGFAHPFSGWDHMLAMLAIGLYAGRQSGAARWALPLGFVTTMLGAAALAQAGIQLPFLEAGIAASVLAMGLLIATTARLSLAVTLPFIALFAACHGAAHYAEKGGASLLSFAAGFALATAALHASGYLLAHQAPQSALGLRLQRGLGVLIAGAGVVMLGA